MASMAEWYQINCGDKRDYETVAPDYSVPTWFGALT